MFVKLEDIVRDSPLLMRALTGARELNAPDWLIVSGAIYQTVLNALTFRPHDCGIKDFDLFYFDGSDLSYEAEDLRIQRVRAIFAQDIADRVELRNQARVHLWFQEKFGEPYEPLGSTEESLLRFVSPIGAVGVRLEANGALTIVAPFGLEDLFALHMRPNPIRRLSPQFAAIAGGVRARWPEVTMINEAGAFPAGR